jgi:NAD(P)-dependent dehydrogenase (short-subunit alcohol dehydrogenase family)
MTHNMEHPQETESRGHSGQVTPEERFGGGVAVVTGGGGGIGEGLVRYLCRIGMHVVIADIQAGRANALAAELTAAGSKASPYVVDVTDPDAVEDLAGWVFKTFPGVDLLINNAGLEAAGLIWEVPPERWKRTMAVNVDGVFFGLRAFLPKMIEAGRPAVVANLSSVGGVSTTPLQAPYIVTKHAVLALTECLHQEVSLVGAPIQVSAILPHMVRSQIFKSAQAEAPAGNAMAAQVFDGMRKAVELYGKDPVEAAEHMVAALARGDFWVFTDDERCKQFTSGRARLLETLTPPADPRPQLARFGWIVD